jgi:hypothetical protein
MNNNPDNQHKQNINPATILPMIENMDIDVCGSPYCMDIYEQVWTPPVPTLENWQPDFGDF